MEIIYVAKHGPRDNQDEDAITFALEKLGHTVKCYQESQAASAIKDSGDFILIHKYEGTEVMKQAMIPVVCWDFDAVVVDDPHLISRNSLRVRLTTERESYCQIMFHTDGNWVDKDPTKRIQLMQGADERYVGYGKPTEILAPIIFTGTTGHGKKRDNHLNELLQYYGSRFLVTGDQIRNTNQPWRLKVHGRNLANRLASSEVIIAPDGPSTHNYWSNRVYLLTGLGGFLIHPMCHRLLDHYGLDELAYYDSREHLIHQIDYYLCHPKERQELREIGHETTLKRHLYRHRCEDLISQVEERLF